MTLRARALSRRALAAGLIGILGVLSACADGSDEQAADVSAAATAEDDSVPVEDETAPADEPNVSESSDSEDPTPSEASTTTAPVTVTEGSNLVESGGSVPNVEVDEGEDAEPADAPVLVEAGEMPPIEGPTVTAPLDEEVDFGTGVTASIVGVEAVEVEARLAGERSGPGLILTVELHNGTPDDVSLDFVIVDLVQSDGASALPIQATGVLPLSGTLAPGATATGRYEFFIPLDQRASATVTVSYAADAATALFSGDLPRA